VEVSRTCIRYIHFQVPKQKFVVVLHIRPIPLTDKPQQLISKFWASSLVLHRRRHRHRHRPLRHLRSFSKAHHSQRQRHLTDAFSFRCATPNTQHAHSILGSQSHEKRPSHLDRALPRHRHRSRESAREGYEYLARVLQGMKIGTSIKMSC
jgi:hypothetical protein